MGIRHSDKIIKTKRWKRIRAQIIKRDGYRCVACGMHGRLEVDHIKPVRSHPELAYDEGNLQALCPTCHSRKTRKDVGLSEVTPERHEWRLLVTHQSTPKIEN